jgi:prefoldin subunit 5
MEIELRDEAIKYLNKQIEDLKGQLRVKDKEIAKLNQQISSMER